MTDQVESEAQVSEDNVDSVVTQEQAPVQPTSPGGTVFTTEQLAEIKKIAGIESQSWKDKRIREIQTELAALNSSQPTPPVVTPTPPSPVSGEGQGATPTPPVMEVDHTGLIGNLELDANSPEVMRAVLQYATDAGQLALALNSIKDAQKARPPATGISTAAPTGGSAAGSDTEEKLISELARLNSESGWGNQKRIKEITTQLNAISPPQ